LFKASDCIRNCFIIFLAGRRRLPIVITARVVTSVVAVEGAVHMGAVPILLDTGVVVVVEVARRDRRRLLTRTGGEGSN